MCQKKGLMKMHTGAKLGVYSISRFSVINFWSLAYRPNGPFWAILGWFFGPYSHNSGPIGLKFWPDVLFTILQHICYGFWDWTIFSYFFRRLKIFFDRLFSKGIYPLKKFRFSKKKIRWHTTCPEVLCGTKRYPPAVIC